MGAKSGWARYALWELFSIGSFSVFMILSLLVTTPFALHAWNRHDVPMYILLGVFSLVVIIGFGHGLAFAGQGLAAYWRQDSGWKSQNRQRVRPWLVRYAVVFAALFAVQLAWLMVAELPLGWSTESKVRWEQLYRTP